MNVIISTIIQAETASFWSQWKDLLLPIITSIAGAVITYFATRSKSRSEIGQIDAETLKTYLQIIKDIQENNQSLYEKLQILREKVDNVDDMLDQAHKDLEKAREELAECVDANTRLNTASQNSIDNLSQND